MASQSLVRRPPVRLLLVNPRFPESFWSFRWALERILPGKRAVNPPLGLATLAALCPPDWSVRIVDENIESIPLEPDADIIGVCGMGVQFKRECEILKYYRSHGYYVVAGGSYASLCPESFEGLAHSVIAGEAEYTWGRFCGDFLSGQTKSLYRETGTVELADSPVPRFDLLKLDQYTTVSLQFSRGCPYRCEFCDIIVMFGRRPRTKRPEQIGRELDLLRERDIHNVFFVDDNLIGNKKAARELLIYLAQYQRNHDYVFRFGTEASLNLALDDELMELFRAAHFTWVFLGIESPDAESLQEAQKTQNLAQDVLTAVRRIYAHGLDVFAGFIVGFDHDRVETFDRQYRFILESGIQASMIGLLTAMPKTPLYERLAREGRLLPMLELADNTKPVTNVVPRHMTAADLVRGYQELYQRLFCDANIAKRIRNKFRYLAPATPREGVPAGRNGTILRHLFCSGLLPGGPVRIYRFVSTLVVTPWRAWPLVITDWIQGLSIRSYIQRHLDPDLSQAQRVVEVTLERLLRHPQPQSASHPIRVTLSMKGTVPCLRVWLEGAVDPAFFQYAARRLRGMLKQSAAALFLCVVDLREDQHRLFTRFLHRLSPYGDRVSIFINRKIQTQMPVDSSVFHLLLEDPTVGLS
jgi:radical SAM superfamily enzyme YgiQ (UPF0313 family)